jgi:plasmid stabilization system protein ParE
VTRRVVFRPQAEDDALEIRQWYEARREGLGAEFGLAVDALVARVMANPLAFQRAHGETRRAVLARFPYAIYFRVVGEGSSCWRSTGGSISRTGEPGRSIGALVRPADGHAV